MPCGCRDKGPQASVTAASSAAVIAGSQVYHEVWVGGSYTGRRFTSLVRAQEYAKARGGKVRTTS